MLPPLVEPRLRTRMFRWCADLHRLQREIDRIDGQLGRLGVPLACTSALYELRGHVDPMRRRLRAEPALPKIMDSA